jgi:5-methylcytosine-specific restriction endonuclease McrA
LSPQWRVVVAAVRAARPDRCEVCHRTKCKLVCDHVIAVKDGGPALDPANVRLTCYRCHTRKSHAERTARQAT